MMFAPYTPEPPILGPKIIDIHTPSLDDVRKVILNPECVRRTAPDGIYMPNFSDWTFYGAYEKSQIIAILSTFAEEDMWRAHFTILIPYRNYAATCATLMLGGIPKLRPIYGDVPTLFPTYINFLKNLDFVDSGYTDDVFTKDGIDYSVIRMIRSV